MTFQFFQVSGHPEHKDAGMYIVQCTAGPQMIVNQWMNSRLWNQVVVPTSTHPEYATLHHKIGPIYTYRRLTST